MSCLRGGVRPDFSKNRQNAILEEEPKRQPNTWRNRKGNRTFGGTEGATEQMKEPKGQPNIFILASQSTLRLKTNPF